MMKERLVKWLDKLFEISEYREGYDDYLREAISTCAMPTTDDYLTAEYVAYELYTNWQATGQLDTVSPFVKTAKLFDRDKSYYKGARTAFDHVWKNIHILHELYHARNPKDAI